MPRVASTLILLTSLILGLNVQASYTRAGSPLLGRTDYASGKHAFYHIDGNRNVTAMINSSQLIVAKYLYDPFGRTLAITGPLAEANTYRFASQRYHANSGLVLYLRRAYSPDLQRFVNRDPIGEAGGLNLFGFVGNDPVNYIDPFGLSEKDVQQIIKTTQSKIDQMTKAGERTGSGITGGAWNNLSKLFVKKRKGCGEQAGSMLEPLFSNSYEDEWKFSTVEVLRPWATKHQFLIVQSSNPKDPVLLLDPHQNMIKTIKKGDKYPGMLLESDTYTKAPGSSSTFELASQPSHAWCQ